MHEAPRLRRRLRLEHLRPPCAAAAIATWCTVTLLGVLTVRADEPAELRTQNDKAKKERAARLEVMRGHARSLTVAREIADKSVEDQLVEAPLLHYNNPAGETLDATLWAWGRQGRPVALASISQELSDSRITKWSCELVSLADEPVLLTAKPGWSWAPKTSGINWKPLADAPAPGETAVVRARQMKEFARRYSATGIYHEGKEVVELRLMDRPLSRYSEPDAGLVDGAIHAFAAGTNPEVLLLVECREEKSGRVWRHGFARMGAGQLIARLGDTVVWQQPAIVQWDRKASYFSTYGPVDAVFVPDSATTDTE